MTRYRRRSIVAAHLTPEDMRTVGEAWTILDDLGTVFRADPACLPRLVVRHPLGAYDVLMLWLHVRLLEAVVLLLRRRPSWL